MEKNEEALKQYMVEFHISELILDDLLQMIPEQTEAIDELFSSGKLLSYSLSHDQSKLWAVFMCDTESELISYIDSLPMSAYLDYDYGELMFHNTVYYIPTMSLN